MYVSVNLCVFQGELMNGVKPWWPVPRSEVQHHDVTSTMEGLASQRIATTDHLPSSI